MVIGRLRGEAEKKFVEVKLEEKFLSSKHSNL